MIIQRCTVLCKVDYPIDISQCFTRKILCGSMYVNSYNKPEKEKDNTYLSRFFRKVLATPSSEPCCFTPDEGNIHEITAEE